MGKYEIPKQCEFDSWNKVIAVDRDGNKISSYNTTLATIFPFHLDVYTKIIKNIHSGKPFHPIRLEISPTDFCNHKCRMCIVRYHYSRLKHNKYELGSDVLMDIISQAEEVGIKLITLSGTGEVFTYKGIEPVLERFIDNFLNLMVFTNGSLISDKGVEYLVKANAIINISINVGDRESYFKVNGEDHYEAVCSNMRKLRENAIRFDREPVLGCSFVVLHENIQTVYSAAKKTKSLGFGFITFKPAAEIGFLPDFTTKERKILAEEIKKAEELGSNDFRVNVSFDAPTYSLPYKRSRPFSPRCFQGIFSLNISSDGGIYPCPTEATIRTNMAVPNVRDTSLKEFIDSKYYANFYKKDFRNSPSHDGCFNEPFNAFANWLYEIITQNNNVSLVCERL